MPLVGHLRESADQHEERAGPDDGQDRWLAHRGRDSFTVHPPTMRKPQRTKLRNRSPAVLSGELKIVHSEGGREAAPSEAR